jgi:AraC-like DNA-binding protein
MDIFRQQELAGLIDKFSNGDGVHACAVPGLNLIRISEINMRIPTLYNPCVCVIVQGEKQVLLENDVYKYTPSEYLSVSVDMPVIGQITKASRDKPYLCLQIDVDIRQLGELIVQTQQSKAPDSETGRALFVGRVGPTLGDAVLRLARLLETPNDIAPLAPMIIREIYYRLLNGEHGTTIAQLATQGSNMHRINSVIQKIKSDCAQPIRVEDMAGCAGMSVSSFHFHFKEVTGMSPLQYQKRMRLMEARRLMLTDAIDATSTAYRVGYESPSQFSREYARMFGTPPMRDVKMMRAARGA